ncbi:uncharacterized protein LOC109832949 [Asparagus officinalis]|uniref:uncharacterized protein LOC109832949 n=1 Tax=Asparagus officinalis TaxID=4686 RepID=UPI00098DE4F9|nr:uncharacterized protein LOC109832949 [Asparagus officinalis]
MEISINSSIISSSSSCNPRKIPQFQIKGIEPGSFPVNRSLTRYNLAQIRMNSTSVRDLQSCKSNLESLFCYDKSVPEEIIEKPAGLSLNKKEIGSNPPCIDCQVKGVVLCATCSGSGLYVDSILESQGIIVKVRCLGCGGTGNIMCSGCGGRGHVGVY